MEILTLEKNKERLLEIDLKLKALDNEENNLLEEIKNHLAELDRLEAIERLKIKGYEEELEALKNQNKNEEPGIVLETKEIEKTNMVVAPGGVITEIPEKEITPKEEPKGETIEIEPKSKNKPELKKEIIYTPFPSREETRAVEHIKTGLLEENEPWSHDKNVPQNRLAVEKDKLWPEDSNAPYIVENIASYTKGKKKKEGKKGILQTISNWIWKNKKPLAIPTALLSTSAVLAGVETHNFTHGAEVRNQKIASERLDFNKLTNWIQETSKDTTIYNNLSPQAKVRFASMMLSDYELGKRAKDTTALSQAEILQKEKDSRVAAEVDLVGMAIAKIESNGDYSKPIQKNNAVGKYGINMRYWAEDLGLADGSWSMKYVREHPGIQETDFEYIYKKLHDKYGNNPEKIFAGFLKPDTGPDDYGTPRGDVAFDESGMTVNKFVTKAMAEYNNLKKATADGGRWLTDAENQKLYFIDLNYQKKYESDIYKIVKGDKNERYLGMVSKPNTYYKVDEIEGFLNTLSRTVNYADVVAKNNQKLVSSQESNPDKVFSLNNKNLENYIKSHPSDEVKIGAKKVSQNAKISRIMKKSKANS